MTKHALQVIDDSWIRDARPRPFDSNQIRVWQNRILQATLETLAAALHVLIRSSFVIMSLEEVNRHVVEFVRVNEGWAAPIVFALAFAESLAFFSLILPSWAALVAIGAIMRMGGIDFVPVWIAGGLGAAFGDWLSYWLGIKFKKSIAGMWPFSYYPHLLPRGEAFIKNWGVLAIFIGRFSGPLRATVPVVAGILAMPRGRFQLANFSSAFVWAAVLLKLGDVGAAISTWLWNEVSGKF
jgi:membrane protein DedA with SNARE-associated domain